MPNLFHLNFIRSEIAEGWYQDENGDWYQADPTEGKKSTLDRSGQQSSGIYKNLKLLTIVLMDNVLTQI